MTEEQELSVQYRRLGDSKSFTELLGNMVNQLLSVQDSLQSCQENSFEDDSGFDTSERLNSVERNLQILIQEIQQIEQDSEIRDSSVSQYDNTNSIMENISLALSNLELNRERILSNDRIKSSTSRLSDDYSLERMVDELFRNVRGLKKILVENRTGNSKSEITPSDSEDGSEQLSKLIELVSNSYSVSDPKTGFGDRYQASPKARGEIMSEDEKTERESESGEEPKDSGDNPKKRGHRRSFDGSNSNDRRYSHRYSDDGDYTEDFTEDNTDDLETTTSMYSVDSEVTMSSVLEYGFIPVNYVITGTISECNTPQSFPQYEVELSSPVSEDDTISSEVKMVVPRYTSKRNNAHNLARTGKTNPKLYGKSKRNRSPELLPELPAPLARKKDMLGIYNKLQDDMSSLSKMVDPDSSSAVGGTEPSSEAFSTETSSSVRRVLGYNAPRLTSDETWSKEFKSNSFEGMLSDIQKETAFVTQNLSDYESNSAPQRRAAPAIRFNSDSTVSEEEADYRRVAGNVNRINQQLRRLKERPPSYLSPGEVKQAEVEWDSFTPNAMVAERPYRRQQADITSESSEDYTTQPKSKLSSIHLIVPDLEYSSKTMESECLSEISKISTPSPERISSLEADKEVRQILGVSNTNSSVTEIKNCILQSVTETSGSSYSDKKIITTEDYVINSLKEDMSSIAKETSDKEIMAGQAVPDILTLFTKPTQDSPYVPNMALLNALLAPSGLTIKSTAVNDVAISTSFKGESEDTTSSEKTISVSSKSSETVENSLHNTDKTTSLFVEKSETQSSLSQSSSQRSRSSSLDHTSHISEGAVVHIIKDRPSTKSFNVPSDVPKERSKPELKTVAVGGNSPLPSINSSNSLETSAVSSAQISERCNKPRIILPPKPKRSPSEASNSSRKTHPTSESVGSSKSDKSSQTSAEDPAKPLLLVDMWTSTNPWPDTSEGVTQTSGYFTVDRSCSPIRTVPLSHTDDRPSTKPRRVKVQPDIYNLNKINNPTKEQSPKKPKLATPKLKYEGSDMPDLSKSKLDWQPSDYEELSSNSEHDTEKQKPKAAAPLDTNTSESESSNTPKFKPADPATSSASDIDASSQKSSDKRELEKALLKALYNKPPINKTNSEALKCLRDQLQRHTNELKNARQQLQASRQKMDDVFNIDRENLNPLENNI